MDVFSKRKRSRIMSRIKSAGTRPERVLRKMLRELSGRSISCNVRSLPGSPDVVIRPLGLAVFMQGCFWHGCPDHGRIPKTRVRFWTAKIRGNARRDKKVARELRKLGWVVWSVWEHDLRKAVLPLTRRRLRRRLRRLERV